jgi:hypothetical protein
MTHPTRDSLATGLPALVAGVLLAAIVLFVPAVLNDGDTYWHLATGAWILDHSQVPHADIFSYSRPGAPWVPHEWLSELLMALAWRAGGWSGLLILFAISLGFAGWLMVRQMATVLSGLSLALTAVLSFACMAASVLARPHLLALPVLIVWTIELLAARRAGRAPRLAFALLMVLWANLHGSFVFGFLLAAAFGLEALVAHEGQPWRVIRGWGLFGVASLAACLVTPLGLKGLIYPFEIMTLKFLPSVGEWRPEDFTKPSIFQISLLVTLFVCLSRGVRIPPIRLLLLLLLVYMGMEHVRHQLVMAAVAPLILAEPLAAALGQKPVARPSQPALWAAFALATAILAGGRLVWPVVRHDDLNTPAAALAHVPASLTRQPVFNDYDFGGYLIFKGVKPFIDGRSDMYGNAFSSDYFRAEAPDPALLRKLLAQYRVAWTILRPNDPVVRILDSEPGWRRLYADDHAVVHERVTPPAPAS